ncbi:RnfH family protein [Azonexus sp.]|uniref:RnfH family protein n=1 Tax=Azonexus sp. TaxID=1872668 RepID=UPI0039E36572
MRVEVCYLAPGVESCCTLDVPENSTLGTAIALSGVLQRHPEIDLERQKVGIWNSVARLDTPLRAADRVEIYRPLSADPKTIRRQRVAEGKTMGGKA